MHSQIYATNPKLDPLRLIQVMSKMHLQTFYTPEMRPLPTDIFLVGRAQL